MPWRWAPLGFFAICLAVQMACVHELEERCPLIETAVRAPSGFAEVDRLLVQRARLMIGEVRALRGSLARSFRIYFSEDTLPLLCGRLEQARSLATSGRIREA